MIIHLFRLIRPKQWIKNFFVFAPLLFSRHIFQLEYLLPSVAAFFIFSLASSAVYIINDVMDVESDRAHPKKKYRPIASGEVSVKQAMIFLVILIIIIIGCLFFQRTIFAFVIVLYFITNRRIIKCSAFALPNQMKRLKKPLQFFALYDD